MTAPPSRARQRAPSTALVAVANGQVVGEVLDYGTGRDYGFRYADAWRFAATAFPLSLSMPLALAAAPAGSIVPFLWGLLPDDHQVLSRWAGRYGVSPSNPVGLLAHVGEDCAGAAQFVPPARVESLLAAQHDEGKIGRVSGTEVQWLSEHDVAERLRDLSLDPGTTRRPGDAGQFSLAGAQPKIALLEWGGRWGVPSGRVPTNRILKPPALERELRIDGLVENEHCCLALVTALGLRAPMSRAVRFEDQVAIVVERYDRAPLGDRLLRVHQEDACQALGVDPAKKYENEGGPGIAAVVALLRQHSTAPTVDVQRFLDMVAVNWIIAGTDAHAKNYSLLLAGEGQVRLAPFYDVVSALPYPRRMPIQKIKLAMQVDGEYGVRRVGALHWTGLATGLLRSLGSDALGGWDADALVERVAGLCGQVSDAIADVRTAAVAHGLDPVFVTRLCDAITTRAGYCMTQLQLGEAAGGAGGAK